MGSYPFKGFLGGSYPFLRLLPLSSLRFFKWFFKLNMGEFYEEPIGNVKRGEGAIWSYGSFLLASLQGYLKG